MRDENRGWFVIFALIVGFLAYMIAAYINNLPILIGLAVGFTSGLIMWVLDSLAKSESAQNADFDKQQKEIVGLQEQLSSLQQKLDQLSKSNNR